MAELTLPNIDDARRFRAMHPNALHESDDHRSKTVRFDRSKLSEEALERAEEQAALEAGQDALEAERLEELEARPTASGARKLVEAAVAFGAIFLLGALLEALNE